MNENKVEKEKKSTSYWIGLSEKYFDALTTEEEEKDLAKFLTTKESEQPEFNEIKAVMGYVSVARKRDSTLTRGKIKKNSIRWISAAAAITLIVGIGISLDDRNKSVEIISPPADESKEFYLAYLDGKEYTDKEVIIEHMHQTMAMIGNTTKGNAVEEQLGAMFSIANDK